MESDLKLTVEAKHRLAIRKKLRLYRTVEIILLICIVAVLAFINLYF